MLFALEFMYTPEGQNPENAQGYELRVSHPLPPCAVTQNRVRVAG